METKYSYQVTVNFDLSNADFELVTEAMKTHSDTEYYTTQGQFWYGNINHNNWRKEFPHQYIEYPPFSATTRQLQLVVKSLEPYVNYGGFSKEDQDRGMRLYYELSAMLKAAIEHANELQAGQEIVK